MGKAKTPDEFEIDFAVEADVPAEIAPAEPAPAAEIPPAADGASAVDAAAEPAPKPARFAAIRANLPLVIAGIAVFTSLIATIGLLVASRNMAEAGVRIAALEQALKDRPHAAAAAVPDQGAGHAAPAPVDREAARAASAADVRRAFNEFRTDLVRYQGMGGNAAFMTGIRDGQAELANRIGIMLEKIDRIDRALASRAPAGQRPMPRHSGE